VRLRFQRLDARLEIDQGLEILLRHAFLGELGNEHMQALRTKRSLVLGV
jgi:hypothetical protein